LPRRRRTTVGDFGVVGCAPPTRPGRRGLNLVKVVFGFSVLLAGTLHFGSFIGDIANPALHNVN